MAKYYITQKLCLNFYNVTCLLSFWKIHICNNFFLFSSYRVTIKTQWILFSKVVTNVKIFGKNASKIMHFSDVLKLRGCHGRKHEYLVEDHLLGNQLYLCMHETFAFNTYEPNLHKIKLIKIYTVSY